MAKNLVIVESPAKARTLERYLGRDFKVTASKGHVKDLPTKELGVDIASDFAPDYVTVRGKGSILKEIRRLSKDAETIFLAPDPDREGEAIAWHIAQEIKQGRRKNTQQVLRILITEITKSGIKRAFDNPLKLNEDRYNSQQARRILDRLVGYQLSPLLWDKVRRGLSAGRVQSVAVRLVVDREREIEAFIAEEFWRIEAQVTKEGPPGFVTRLLRHKGKPLKVTNSEQAGAIVDFLEQASYSVAKVERKERKRRPTAPFITSTLQQEAARKLKMNAKRTMRVAQKLYEGISLGDDGLTGLITYMRTDSTRVSDQAVTACRELVKERYGKEWIPPKPRVYAKNKKAQDAHEAIRPSSVDRSPDSVKSYLDRDQFRLYQLIWRRFVASQMASAKFDATVIDVQAGDYTLRATGSVLKFAGFLELYSEGKDDDGNGNDKDRRLPYVEQGDVLEKLAVTSEQCFTKPPARYSEATLVKELEERGIGRPSTYASIISVIQDKAYAEKEKARFHPTELGRVVTDLLVESFPDVLDVEFTAGMEDELDKIEDGKLAWTDVLASFYQPFAETLVTARKEMRDVKREATPTDIECDECGANMVIRWGRNGSFLACSKYPECKNTREFKRENGKVVLVVPEIVVAGSCEKCGADMIIKSGKYGRFRACSRYPDCKSTAPITTGVTCPICKNGEVVEKRSKRGKTFFGCNRFPDCKFASWDELLNRACEHCDSPYLLRKIGRDASVRVTCPSCKAQFKPEELSPETTTA